jgi:hypothetical protein
MLVIGATVVTTRSFPAPTGADDGEVPAVLADDLCAGLAQAAPERRTTSADRAASAERFTTPPSCHRTLRGCAGTVS